MKYKSNNMLIEGWASTYHLPKIFDNGKLCGGAGNSLYISSNNWESKQLLYSVESGSTFRGVLGIDAGVLIAGVDNKIMRSADGGISFNTVLSTKNEGDTFGL